MGVLDAIRSRKRQDAINRAVQGDYEEGSSGTSQYVYEDEGPQGDISREKIVGATPGGLNFKNAVAALYRAGYGTDALALEQSRENNAFANMLKQAQAQKFMRPGGEEGHPSSVREWEYYQSLKPEDQERFLTMKRATKFLDTGEGYVAPSQVNPTVTRSVVDRKLKPTEQLNYINSKEAEEEKGKSRGQAEMELPKAESGAQQTINLIEELRNHPGRTWATGATSIIPKIPGSPQADFIARLDQLKGKQFLEAYQTLKGGGQITEVEGKKAENAIARMDRSQSEGEFLKALDEFQDAVKVGTAKLAQKAGKPASASTAPKAAPTQKDLEFTALKHKISIQEVKKRLGIK